MPELQRKIMWSRKRSASPTTVPQGEDASGHGQKGTSAKEASCKHCCQGVLGFKPGIGDTLVKEKGTSVIEKVKASNAEDPQVVVAIPSVRDVGNINDSLSTQKPAKTCSGIGKIQREDARSKSAWASKAAIGFHRPLNNGNKQINVGVQSYNTPPATDHKLVAVTSQIPENTQSATPRRRPYMSHHSQTNSFDRPQSAPRGILRSLQLEDRQLSDMSKVPTEFADGGNTANKVCSPSNYSKSQTLKSAPPKRIAHREQSNRAQDVMAKQSRNSVNELFNQVNQQGTKHTFMEEKQESQVDNGLFSKTHLESLEPQTLAQRSLESCIGTSEASRLKNTDEQNIKNQNIKQPKRELRAIEYNATIQTPHTSDKITYVCQHELLDRDPYINTLVEIPSNNATAESSNGLYNEWTRFEPEDDQGSSHTVNVPQMYVKPALQTQEYNKESNAEVTFVATHDNDALSLSSSITSILRNRLGKEGFKLLPLNNVQMRSKSQDECKCLSSEIGDIAYHKSCKFPGWYDNVETANVKSGSRSRKQGTRSVSPRPTSGHELSRQRGIAHQRYTASVERVLGSKRWRRKAQHSEIKQKTGNKQVDLTTSTRQHEVKTVINNRIVNSEKQEDNQMVSQMKDTAAHALNDNMLGSGTRARNASPKAATDVSTHGEVTTKHGTENSLKGSEQKGIGRIKLRPKSTSIANDDSMQAIQRCGLLDMTGIDGKLLKICMLHGVKKRRRGKYNLSGRRLSSTSYTESPHNLYCDSDAANNESRKAMIDYIFFNSTSNSEQSLYPPSENAICATFDDNAITQDCPRKDNPPHCNKGKEISDFWYENKDIPISDTTVVEGKSLGSFLGKTQSVQQWLNSTSLSHCSDESDVKFEGLNLSLGSSKKCHDTCENKTIQPSPFSLAKQGFASNFKSLTRSTNALNRKEITEVSGMTNPLDETDIRWSAETTNPDMASVKKDSVCKPVPDDQSSPKKIAALTAAGYTARNNPLRWRRETNNSHNRHNGSNRKFLSSLLDGRRKGFCWRFLIVFCVLVVSLEFAALIFAFFFHNQVFPAWQNITHLRDYLMMSSQRQDNRE